jgi:hypothetical protein
MAPVPAPKPWNPLAPIQNNWDKIGPVHSAYGQILGGLGTIFGVAAAIAVIVEHGGKFPKWPFTRARWNPKPKVDGGEGEVTEDQIVEDELAEVVGAVGKRSLHENELQWFNDGLLQKSAKLVARNGTYHIYKLTDR